MIAPLRYRMGPMEHHVTVVPGVVLRIAAQDWRVLLNVFLQGELHLSGRMMNTSVTMQMNPLYIVYGVFIYIYSICIWAQKQSGSILTTVECCLWYLANIDGRTVGEKCTTSQTRLWPRAEENDEQIALPHWLFQTNSITSLHRRFILPSGLHWLRIWNKQKHVFSLHSGILFTRDVM